MGSTGRVVARRVAAGAPPRVMANFALETRRLAIAPSLPLPGGLLPYPSPHACRPAAALFGHLADGTSFAAGRFW